MEAVLDRKAVRRGCKLVRNEIGLYDLQINDELGYIIVDVRNITFLRAIAIIEERMYSSGSAE